ncbi:MAG: cyclic nucleotide-binding domain-containing protein [Chromatiales bacterium]|jgi:CRP-like cAMP-binding protein|nr:cyclic nucleotide-binding domain-containing protein [Chromatiales bacterium]
MGAFSLDLTAEALTQLRFFEGESPDALEWLLDACSCRNLAAGDVLLEPEQENRALYVVLSGILDVRLSREGQVITQLGRGECAGEMSVLDSTQRHYIGQTDGARLRLKLAAMPLFALAVRSHTVLAA